MGKVLETDLTEIYCDGDQIKINHIEHAWLPACQQEYCRINNQRGYLALQGCWKTLALKIGHQGGNLGIVGISASFSVVKNGSDGWMAYWIPILPAMG